MGEEEERREREAAWRHAREMAAWRQDADADREMAAWRQDADADLDEMPDEMGTPRTKSRLERAPQFRPCPTCGVMVEQGGAATLCTTRLVRRAGALHAALLVNAATWNAALPMPL